MPKKDDWRKKTFDSKEQTLSPLADENGEERLETRKPIRCRLDDCFATHLGPEVSLQTET